MILSKNEKKEEKVERESRDMEVEIRILYYCRVKFGTRTDGVP